nr:hypothetical protein [Tanacetum cinerariifolium]
MAQTPTRNHAPRGHHKHYARIPLSNTQRHVVPPPVLTQPKLVPINAVRPVSTAVPKTSMTRPRHDKIVVTKPNSPLRRYINRSPSPKASTFPLKVTVVKAPMVNAAQGNPQHALKDKGVIDSGCSRHMTGNMSYLSNFKELNGGYVAFGGNSKGGLENQLSLKVKVIRSDNGTEFKNNDLNQLCGIKGIKREFSVPRTLQQNGITERKNKTLIEAARTMLADLLLPILLWAEAANTACYVQNRVLVTKPQNKTPYELLHGRTPSISFMRPLAILTRIVQETLHVNFLENKPNVAGSGPTWLFDIDTLTKTMNYQPVTVGNESNPSAGVQDKFDAEKAGEEIVQQYVLFPVWSSGRKPESKVNVSPSSSAQSKKHDDKTKREAKGKSPVESLTRYKNLSVEFEDLSDNSINEDNVVGTLVPAIGQLSPNSTKTFSAAGPSNAAASLTHGKSSCIDTSQLPDDPNMPELEDITYSDDEDDVGAEADFKNLETSITVSPISTTRVHKDHLVTQIIGDLSLATQTRSMTRVAKDQGELSQINNDDFHTLKQKKDGILISQDKYVAEILRKFGLTDGKSASTLKDTEKPLMKDLDGEDVDVHTYRSMIGSLMYLTLSRPEIMFAVCCKKQTVVATSSTEVEYVAAASYCAQVLWIQNQLLDYG